MKILAWYSGVILVAVWLYTLFIFLTSLQTDEAGVNFFVMLFYFPVAYYVVLKANQEK